MNWADLELWHGLAFLGLMALGVAVLSIPARRDDD